VAKTSTSHGEINPGGISAGVKAESSARRSAWTWLAWKPRWTGTQLLTFSKTV